MTEFKEVALGHVAEFIRGITFKPEDCVEPHSEGSVVCMRTKNIQRDLDQDDLISVPRSFVRNDVKMLRNGDVLVSSANSWNLVGKCCYVPNLEYEATAGGFISVLRGSPSCSSRYLYHWLNSPSVQHKARHCGRQTTNISNLDVERFLSLLLPLPPLEEQRRIAAILDKADAIRRKREEALKLTDMFLRTTFLEMFGDPATNPKGFEVSAVETVLTTYRAGIQSGPFGASLKKHELVPEGIPVWGVDSVQQNNFVPSTNQFITEKKFQDLERYAVLEGDLLISRAGTVGRMCVADDVPEKSIISTNLVRVSLNRERMLPEYFAALFSFAGDRLGGLKANQKENAFTFLNPKTLKALEVPIPSIIKQREYCEVRDKVIQCSSSMAEAIENTASMFSSLSQRAFRGEL